MNLTFLRDNPHNYNMNNFLNFNAADIIHAQQEAEAVAASGAAVVDSHQSPASSRPQHHGRERANSAILFPGRCMWVFAFV